MYQMSYGNRPQYGQKNYSQGYGPRKSYGNRSYNNSQRAPKKHSACTVQKDFKAAGGKTKAIFIKGWKYTRKNGLMSFVAVPASSKYQKGKNHTTMVVSWTSAMGKSTLWGYWNFGKQILSIPDLRIVASGASNYVSYLKPKGFK